MKDKPFDNDLEHIVLIAIIKKAWVKCFRCGSTDVDQIMINDHEKYKICLRCNDYA